MIRFTLKCENDHSFESWFPSNDAFDVLKARGLIVCPDCASCRVDKGLMTPKVRASRSAVPEPVEAPKVMTNTPDPKFVEAVQALKAHVEKTSDYVGADFASEARAMHEGDKPHRSIYGEARADEARKLVEDGVPALPLPFIPRQKTN